MTDLEALLLRWNVIETARTALPHDREIIDAASPTRSLVLERAAMSGSHDEIFEACSTLGRVIGQLCGTPTLAARTLDFAVEVLPPSASEWLPWGRAALHEAYTEARIARAQDEAAAAWEFPGCAVPLGDGCIAIAAGFPLRDDDAVIAWAARTARGAATMGARKAIVSGGASGFVRDALQVMGIRVILPNENESLRREPPGDQAGPRT